jgi:hypothetical protein
MQGLLVVEAERHRKALPTHATAMPFGGRLASPRGPETQSIVIAFVNQNAATFPQAFSKTPCYTQISENEPADHTVDEILRFFRQM